MTRFGSDTVADEVILLARILLVLLYLIFGWQKLTNYSATAGYLGQEGLPLPGAAALIAIVVEFFVSIAVVIGIWTRPLALVLALYTLVGALIGHHYWTMADADRAENMINFYKNISIIGGCLLLYVTGAGRYSLDARLGVRPGLA
jgi:putative oxidoreductase